MRADGSLSKFYFKEVSRTKATNIIIYNISEEKNNLMLDEIVLFISLINVVQIIFV